MRQALREHMGPDDLEQVRLFVEKSFPMPELAQLRHGHISLEQVRPFMQPDAFRDYFKFAFVRNPFDRFVSYCAFATRTQGLFDQNPKAVMRHFLFTAPPTKHILFQPQHIFLIGADGQPLTDFVGRVENMQSDYDAICERVGIPSTALAKANTSRRRGYREYYDQALIEGVTRFYSRDLELFGYEF